MRDKGTHIFTIKELKWINEMTAMLQPLKKEEQTALLWVICHMDFLDMITSGKIMSEQEEQKWKEKATEDNSYLSMALIYYKKLKDQERDEK